VFAVPGIAAGNFFSFGTFLDSRLASGLELPTARLSVSQMLDSVSGRVSVAVGIVDSETTSKVTVGEGKAVAVEVEGDDVAKTVRVAARGAVFVSERVRVGDEEAVILSEWVGPAVGSLSSSMSMFLLR
jgi:hypothetical protein